jgi:hypothetical protein
MMRHTIEHCSSKFGVSGESTVQLPNMRFEVRIIEPRS